MRKLEVVTKTYAADFDLYEILHDSVRRYAGAGVTHTVVVDDVDRALFRRFSSDSCRVLTVGEVLPGHFIRPPRSRVLLNRRRPWPPVRGWVTQQLVKLAVSAASEADALLMVDSDVVMTRPFDAQTFEIDGRPAFYKRDAAIHEGMARHVMWHAAARRLLGLPQDSTLPLTDYVGAFNLWEPEVARALRQRVESATGRDWLTSIGEHLHVSEFILYGVFVDAVFQPDGVTPVDRMRCQNYWDDTPLDLDGALSLVDRASADDVALMISAKSGTPLDVRRRAVQRAQA